MEQNENPFYAAFELVKKNAGTSGQVALAKAILSLYNGQNAFSMGEILLPLDKTYTAVVVGMVSEYARIGETPELEQVGRWVCDNFPRLLELSKAMSDARAAVHQRWNQEWEEENRRLHPEDYE